MNNQLSGAQMHRAAGVLLAVAAGDALGAGYEFGPALPSGEVPRMAGGGAFGWAPGEWTDDTAMAIAIAEVAATGLDLRESDSIARISARWCEWATTSKDVGIQTSAVLSAAQRAAGGPSPTGEQMRTAAQQHHARTGRTAGNGSLMRTAPVALAYLNDPDGLTEAAGSLSELTHHDPEAGQACVLWCQAIRHAVLTGELDIRIGLGQLPDAAAEVWIERIETAESGRLQDFPKNGWVVHAFQEAWCAIANTPIPRDAPSQGSHPANHLRFTLQAIAGAGGDTDTVAAIAGGLLGARYGASAVPAAWRQILHGWPGLRGQDLIALAVLIANGGRSDKSGWPTTPRISYHEYGEVNEFAVHPQDPHVLLGGVGILDNLPAEVDAVISLCRLGTEQVDSEQVTPERHVMVWLVDSANPQTNPNLDFVLADTAAALTRLLADGHTVLVHCVQARSRTPTIGAIYSVQKGAESAEAAIAQMQEVLPNSHPNAAFQAALQRASERTANQRDSGT